MKTKIQFSTENAAFSDNKEYEIARILRGIAQRIENGIDCGKIIDINGNTIGKFEV